MEESPPEEVPVCPCWMVGHQEAVLTTLNTVSSHDELHTIDYLEEGLTSENNVKLYFINKIIHCIWKYKTTYNIESFPGGKECVCRLSE